MQFESLKICRKSAHTVPVNLINPMKTQPKCISFNLNQFKRVFENHSINGAHDFWNPNCMNIDGSGMFSIQWNESFQWKQIKMKLSRYPSQPYIKIGLLEWNSHHHRRRLSGCPVRLRSFHAKTSNLMDKLLMNGVNLQAWWPVILTSSVIHNSMKHKMIVLVYNLQMDLLLTLFHIDMCL